MLSQLFVNAVIAGSLYALVAVSFALIYRIAGFFHFTHGLTFAAGAYVTFAAHAWLRLPLVAAGAIGVVAAALLGMAIRAVVFRSLARRAAPPLVMLLASLGVYVVGQNVISLAFGDSSRPLGESVISPGLAVFGARVTEAQLASIAVVAAVLMGFAVVMTTIGIGHQIQAVANDRELSEVVGISIAAIDGLVFTLGSAMAGLAGILWAIDQNMTPTMGMRALLIGVVAMIIGGQKTVSGVVLASMFLALAQNYSILFVPTAWQDAIVFLILVAFLLVSPSGFFGLRGRRRSLT